MGNMGMADSEWHEKSERTAREREQRDVTPEPTDALVERVRDAMTKDGPGGRLWVNTDADAALTELAERLKAAERELAWFRKTRVTERAQRDELVEALENAGNDFGLVAAMLSGDSPQMRTAMKGQKDARAALAKALRR